MSDDGVLMNCCTECGNIWHDERAMRLRDALTWQPIDTAPKDGTHVLVACPNRGVLRGRWESDRFAKRPRPYWTNDASWIFGVLATRDDQPTHWMPLPERPS